jgi:arylsulfatase A-like enzyme
MARRSLFTSALAIIVIAASAFAEDKQAEPRHVVLIVWDGMRSDFATEKYAPTLDKLARDGARFPHHHSVYPTATNVNGTALATGCYPNKNGICANLEFRPAINAREPIDTAEPDTIKRGDEISGGKYLAAPTFVEQLRTAGRSVALVGTKSVVQLFDRHNNWTIVPMRKGPLTIFAGAPINAVQRDELVKAVGPFFDDTKATAAQRNDFSTRALTEFLWRDGVPDFSLLWLSEPDLSEHNFAPGSPQAIGAIKAADADLATVLAALDKKHARDSTDVFVVSDHGFSTIHRSIDIIALLNAAGFHADSHFSDAPKTGDILVAGNAGTVLFYAIEHDAEVTARLADWLERSDFAGQLFTREKLEGTFPLEAINVRTPDAADLVMAFRFSGEKNQFGVPGMIDADWNRPAGEGTHATLGASDVHNVLIAGGPDFRYTNETQLPSGNVDIAPTVLRILGIEGGSDMDGRVLIGQKKEAPTEPVKHMETSQALDHGAWKQSFTAIKVGHTTYFEGANDSPK